MANWNKVVLADTSGKVAIDNTSTLGSGKPIEHHGQYYGTFASGAKYMRVGTMTNTGTYSSGTIKGTVTSNRKYKIETTYEFELRWNTAAAGTNNAHFKYDSSSGSTNLYAYLTKDDNTGLTVDIYVYGTQPYEFLSVDVVSMGYVPGVWSMPTNDGELETSPTGSQITPTKLFSYNTSGTVAFKVDGGFEVSGASTFSSNVTIGSNELILDAGEKVFSTSGYVVADGDAGFIARDSGTNKLIINGSNATFELSYLNINAGGTNAAITCNSDTMHFIADTNANGGDNPFEWWHNSATIDGGTKIMHLSNNADLWIGNDLSVTGSATINGITSSSNLVVNGSQFDFFRAVNSGNPEFHMGSSDTNKLHIQTVYDSGAQTLARVDYRTYTASGTADAGSHIFHVDEVQKLKIDDGGIDVVGSINTVANTTSVLGNLRNTHASGYGLKIQATDGTATNYIATFNDKDDNVKAKIAGNGHIEARSLYTTEHLEVRKDTSAIYLSNTANSKYHRIHRNASQQLIFDAYDGSSTITNLTINDEGDTTFGGNILLSKSSDGGDSSLTINNSAGVGSADETSSLIFQTVGMNAGKIVSGREYNYSTADNRDSNLKFYTSANNTDGLALTIASNKQSTFTGNINLGDSIALSLGSSTDSQIWNDGSHTYFRNNTASQDMIFKVRVGSTDTEAFRLDGATANSEFSGTIITNGGASTSGLATSDMALQIGGNGTNGQYNAIGFGYNGQTQVPAIIAYKGTSGAGSTRGELGFYTRSVTTNTAPTQRMVISESGNVGIGTSSPAGLLEVSGSVSSFLLGTGASNMQAKFKTTSTHSQPDVFIVDGDNNDARAALQIQGNGGSTEVLFAASTGKVGIGTTAPTNTLHVSGNLEINSHSTSTATTDIDKIIFRKQHATAGAGYQYTLGEIRSWTNGGYSGGLDFYTGRGTGGGSYASTFAMRIADTGKVGIGTSSPQKQLSLYADGSAPELCWEIAGNSGARNWAWRASGSTWGDFQLRQGSSLGGVVDTPRLTILDGGNVGIGTTSSYASSTLTLNGNQSALAISRNTGTDPTWTLSSDATRLYLSDDGNTTYNMTWKNDGNVGIGTTSPSQKLDVNGNIIADSLYLNETVTRLQQGGGESVRITTSSGYVDIGAMNSAYCHLYTDRGGFFLDSNIYGAISLHLGGYGTEKINISYDSNYGKLYSSGGVPLSLGSNGDNNKLVIATSGNVGIGITAPEGNLHVKSAATSGRPAPNSGADELVIEGSGDSGLTIFSGTSSSGKIAFGDDNHDIGRIIYDHNSDDLSFWTGGSERVTIAGGYIGIGDSTPQYAIEMRVPSADIRMYSTTTTNRSGVQPSNAGGTSYFYRESSGGGGALTGSTGYATVVSGTGAYPLQLGTNDAVRMTISSTGNVGIGTTSPTHLLSVANSGSGTDMSIGTYSAGKTAAVLYTSADTNGYFAIQSYLNQGSTFGDIILNPQGGDIGIGTTSPDFFFTAIGDATGDQATINQTHASYAGSALKIGAVRAANSAYNLLYCATGTNAGGTGGTGQFVVRGDGNVGIGETSPAQPIEISNSSGGASAGAVIRLSNKNTNVTSADLVGKIEAYIKDSSQTNLPGIAGDLYWSTNGGLDGGLSKGTDFNIRVFRASALGNALTITSDKTATFYGALNTVDGSASAPSITFTSDTDTGFYAAGSAGIAVTNAGSNEFLFEADGDFHADGDVIGFSTSVASDKRLKTDVEELEGNLDNIMKLEPVKFDWLVKDRGEDIGFIAQDVQKIVPEVVKEVEAIGHTAEFLDDDAMLTVDYAKLVPVLVGAIQELKQEIEELKHGVRS